MVTQQSGTDSQTLAVLTHALGIFTWLIGPLIILLTTKDTLVKNHAKNALNWQITYTILFGIIFVGVFASMILGMLNPLFFILYFILFLVIFALSLVNIIVCIIATVKASKGELWTYPLSFPFLRTE